VDDISLRVKKNEMVGIVGESGCGKSMTAYTIMRLVPIPGRTIEGRIMYRGRDLLSLNEEEMRKLRGKEVSMIFQDPMTFLNPVMKIGDQIAEVILLHTEASKEEARERVVKSLERTRIPAPEAVYDYYPHQLSGGMRQRCLVSMALANNPSLLMADEPTTALDVTIQNQILRLLNTLKQELGISIVLITHDMGVIAETCDYVFVMYAGKVVEGSGIQNLFKSPRHPYAQMLIASVKSLLEAREKFETIPGIVPNLVNPPEGCRFHPRCPHAMDICSEKEPPLKVYDDRHDAPVACWLFEKR
jgi:oligopeptide/dipeptide ABC transporter ATP-binding protein